MSAVGLIGIILCLAALPFYPPARTQRGLLLFACLLVLHIAASVAFYEYALTSSADASLYYFDATGLRRSEMGFGTIFTIKLVQAVKAVIGGTYLDFFLIFQTFGFWGLLFFQRCIEHAQRHFGDAITPPPYWLLFLPGLHFWTGAIGKDAPLFLCVGLATWASIRLSSRAIWFAVAVAIMTASSAMARTSDQARGSAETSALATELLSGSAHRSDRELQSGPTSPSARAAR